MKPFFFALLLSQSIIGLSQGAFTPNNTVSSTSGNLIKLDSIFLDRQGGARSSFIRRYFTYHPNGSIQNYKSFEYSTVYSKFPRYKEERNYTDIGNMTDLESYEMNSSNIWEKSSKEVLSYDGNGRLIEKKIYSNGGAVWRENHKETYRYNADGQVSLRSSFNFDNGSWKSDRLESFTYVNQRVDKVELIMFINGTNVLVSEENYTYQNGRVIKIVEYGDYLGAWILRYETIFSYNSNGDLLERKLRNKDTGSWILDEHEQNTYSTNYPYLLEEKLLWNGVYRKEEYFYYPNNAIETILFSTRIQFVWEEKYRTEFDFDFSYIKSQISVPVSHSYEYKIDGLEEYEKVFGSWEKYRTSQYFYSDREPLNVLWQDVKIGKVYPNPSKGSFWIAFENQGRRAISIHDLTGKLLFQKVSNSDKIMLETNIKPGAYILKCEGSQTSTVTKIIIE